MRRGLGLFLLLALALAQADRAAYLERFDWAWRLVADVYYDPAVNGVDWEALGRRYRERVARAKTWAEVYELIAEMYRAIGDDHTRFVPPWEARALLAGGACYPLPYPEAWSSPVPEVEPPEGASGEDEGFFGGAEARVEEGVLYLRLPDLVAAENYQVLADAIAEHGNEVSGYVLDLRGNPGGVIYEMARTAALFVRGWLWRLVMRGAGAIPEPTLPFWGEPPAKRPLAVLIDGDVHSAAEGLAGGLKASGRAVLFGERTAGNTEALIPYCFPEGAVALVAAGVLAPLRGPTWEGRGVEPDFPTDPDEALNAAIRYLKGARR